MIEEKHLPRGTQEAVGTRRRILAIFPAESREVTGSRKWECKQRGLELIYTWLDVYNLLYTHLRLSAARHAVPVFICRVGGISGGGAGHTRSCI